MELDRAVGGGRGELDPTASVPKGVVDQVPERLLEPEAIGLHTEAVSGPPEHVRPPVEAADDAREELVDVDVLDAERDPASVAARDQEQVLGELREALRLARRRGHRGPQFGDRARLARGQLELGAEQRERRPQLVARVGDELPLTLEGRLEPVEHLVQRRPEPLQLIAGRRHRQPLAGRLGRDRGRAPAHRLDLLQRDAREAVADERGEEERDRAGDQELVAEARQRLRPILAGRADDEDAGSDRDGQQPRRLVEPRQRRAVRVERVPTGLAHLGRLQQRHRPERTGRLEHVSARVEELGVALSALDEAAARVLRERRVRLTDERGEVL